jgi:hypothetical protein
MYKHLPQAVYIVHHINCSPIYQSLNSPGAVHEMWAAQQVATGERKKSLSPRPRVAASNQKRAPSPRSRSPDKRNDKRSDKRPHQAVSKSSSRRDKASPGRKGTESKSASRRSSNTSSDENHRKNSRSGRSRDTVVHDNSIGRANATTAPVVRRH